MGRSWHYSLPSGFPTGTIFAGSQTALLVLARNPSFWELLDLNHSSAKICLLLSIHTTKVMTDDGVPLQLQQSDPILTAADNDLGYTILNL